MCKHFYETISTQLKLNREQSNYLINWTNGDSSFALIIKALIFFNLPKQLVELGPEMSK